MNKIIGFTISNQEIKHTDVDIFKQNIKLINFKKNSFNIYLWGIGDIDKCKINDSYCLSFPLNTDLLDRNVLISFDSDSIIIENDWLGSIPVFYNKKDLIISTLPLKTLTDKIIDDEGLYNYLEFGYSILEHTPYKNVQFMRYYSKLIMNDKIDVIYKDDPIKNISNNNTEISEEIVWQNISSYIKSIESKIDGEIILPLSGGFDSRILSFFINDKSRIRSFTYGISKKQDQSREVVRAKKISKILNFNWEQITLTHYHKYIDEWYKIYGFATHLHGMYHIEFYKRIIEKYKFNNKTLISGIIGDAWAEKGKFNSVDKLEDLINLGYSHGLCIRESDIRLNKIQYLKKEFWENNYQDLKNEKYRSIAAMRFKIILLSYLMQIPDYYGIATCSPFLNMNIAFSMLNLNPDRRIKRQWQKDFFKKNNLYIEELNLKYNKTNTLNFEAAKNHKFDLINGDLLKDYVSQKQLKRINSALLKISFINRFRNKLNEYPFINSLFIKLGIKNNFMEMLFSYYVVKPFEKSLK